MVFTTQDQKKGNSPAESPKCECAAVLITEKAPWGKTWPFCLQWGLDDVSNTHSQVSWRHFISASQLVGLWRSLLLRWDSLVFSQFSRGLQLSALFLFSLVSFSSVCFSTSSHSCVLSSRLLCPLLSPQLNLSCPLWVPGEPLVLLLNPCPASLSPPALSLYHFLSVSRPQTLFLALSFIHSAVSLPLSSCPLGLSSLFSFAMTSLFHLTSTFCLSPSFQSCKPRSSSLHPGILLLSLLLSPHLSRPPLFSSLDPLLFALLSYLSLSAPFLSMSQRWVSC